MGWYLRKKRKTKNKIKAIGEGNNRMKENKRSTNERIYDVGRSCEIRRVTQRPEHRIRGLQGQRKDEINHRNVTSIRTCNLRQNVMRISEEKILRNNKEIKISIVKVLRKGEGS